MMDRYEWQRRHGSSPAQQSVEAQTEQKEAQRQERRRVKVLNKRGLAAEEVRQTKITEWLTRKTLPTGHKQTIAAFITDTLWKRHDLLGVSRQMGDARQLAATMLGIDPADLIAATEGATADRTQLVNLAITLGAHEASVTKDAWRNNDYRSHQIGVYFQFLTEVIGYTLAEVEEAMAGTTDPATIDID